MNEFGKVKFATFAFTVLFILLLLSPILPHLNDRVPDNPNPTNGFIFDGVYMPADITYFQQNLDLLRAQLPDWYQYVMEARPVTFNFDPQIAAHGRAAESRCCDEFEMGTITFGHHFGKFASTTTPNGQSAEGRRITFFGLIAHEVTHIRDARAGLYTNKADRNTCIAAESAGLNKQLEIKRALLNINLTDDPLSVETYRTQLNQQITLETSRLHSRAFWAAYCGDL